MGKRKLVLVFDNTMGIPHCDVDDGLALLYLLGWEEIEILGLVACFGNSSTEKVYRNTEKLLEEIGRRDIPLFRGGERAGDYESEGAEALSFLAKKHEGELEILATGCLTDLCGASERKKDFFRSLSSLTIMGGITEELIFRKKKMEELNLSVDYEASLRTLCSFPGAAVLTGNQCRKVIFPLKEFQERLSSSELGRYILKKSLHWFIDNEEIYGIPGFINWDVTAAIYLARPELFFDHRASCRLCGEDLKHGFLRRASPGESGNAVLNLPEIREDGAFREAFYGGISASFSEKSVLD